MIPLRSLDKKDQFCSQDLQSKNIFVNGKNYDFTINNYKKTLSVTIPGKSTPLKIHLSNETFGKINSANTDVEKNKIIGKVIVKSEALYKWTVEKLKEEGAKDRSVFKLTDNEVIVYTKKEGISRLFKRSEQRVWQAELGDNELDQVAKPVSAIPGNSDPNILDTNGEDEESLQNSNAQPSNSQPGTSIVETAELESRLTDREEPGATEHDTNRFIQIKSNAEAARSEALKQMEPVKYDPEQMQSYSFEQIGEAFAAKMPKFDCPIGKFVHGTSDSLAVEPTTMDSAKINEDKTRDNGITYSTISGYSKEPNGVLFGEPFADNAMALKWDTEDRGKLFLYSGADGCGWGPKSQNAAILANQGFIATVSQRLMADSESITNIQDLTKTAFEGLGNAKAQVEATEGSTTHVGIIAKQDADGKVKGIITSVGDMKVFLRKKDGTVIELTRGNRGNATNTNDSGGRFGKGDPLGNLSAWYFEAEAGDVLLPMSDGVHDNLDPYYRGIENPMAALEILKQAGVPGSENLEIPSDKKWSTTEGWKRENDCPELANLKDLYMTYQLSLVVEDKQPEKMAEALVQSSYELGKERRMFVESTGKREPVVSPEYPGKMDHISCGAIIFGAMSSSSSGSGSSSSSNS